MKSLNSLCLVLCTILFISCSQSLDFDQIDDYTTKPTFSTSLIFFTIRSNDFFTIAGMPAVTEIEQETDFKIFESSFIKNNLVQLDFDFEIRNEFNHDFTIEVSLLSENGNLIYKLQDLKVASNNLTFKQKDVIDIVTNPNIKNFTRVSVKLRLDDTTTLINASDVSTLTFKSAATIYIETSF
jgi:hypothetical protein